MNATMKKVIWVWAALLAVLLAGPARASVPTVNGLFYGDGDSARYNFLAENPGRGRLYTYLDGTTLYIAMVVSNTVNDNVFGTKSQDGAYMTSAGWSAVHSADRLVGSDNMRFQLTVGTTVFDWNHGYVYDLDNDSSFAEKDWLSGPGDGSIGGVNNGNGLPPGLVSASSMQWNMNNTLWDVTLGGTRPNSDTWKSIDADADNNVTDEEGYPTYSPTWKYEWAMVYEFSVDLSAYAGQDLTLRVVSAHNSPGKDGEDVPVDSVDLYDFGDAPASYGTLLPGGARHVLLIAGPKLGNGVDPDIDGTPTTAANGDDVLDGQDDEDGVTFLSPLIPGANMSIQVVGTAGAKLDAWIDWTNNGTFDAGDRITAIAGLTLTGTNVLSVAVPANAVTNAPLYARFRVSTVGGLLPTGLAADGEVEDYIIAASLGDRVWLDTDKDGIQDGNEIGLGNVTVELYSVVGGVTNFVTSDTTDVNGGYLFENLAPGTYFVKFYLPDATYEFSPRYIGGNPALDSNADTTNGVSELVILQAGENNLTIDAGMKIKTTLAVVIGFDAVLLEDGQVAVQWQTSSEKGTLGYYVERLDETSGAYARVNAMLVPAKIMVQGVRSYSVIDAAAAAGGTYTYRLIELENTGTLNAYGPYVVTVAGGAEDSGAEDGATADGDGAVLNVPNVPVVPAVEVAVPVISALTAGTGHMVIRWSSAAGQTYRLERSADLKSFETVAEGIPATAPENVTVVVDGAQAGFYRVTVE